jgi:CRP-like cAMP-binding protein
MHHLTDAQFAAILANVSKHIRPTPEEALFWRGLLRVRSVKRGECLLQVGDVSRHQYFVVSGCLRTYLVAEDGKEHILQFAPEDWWTGNMASMQEQQPSQLIIDTLEDTEVLAIDKPGQELLYERIPKFERFFRILITNAFIAQQRRTLSSLSKTAEERYAEFRKLYPSLDGRVAQKHIASYLGMTPEFLSTVRKRVLSKR